MGYNSPIYFLLWNITVNIFVLNNDPIIAAQEQCDKHVVKMILESAQMLSTAHRMLDGAESRRPSKSGKTMSRYWELSDARENSLYKAVHMHHPCTVWTMESVANYNWHYKHFVALCDEYRYRYSKVHSTDTKLRDALKAVPNNIPAVKQTPFKLAMGANPECMFEDAVKSYRAFYHTKQERFKMSWTKRSTPKWFQYV
jgi:hypothetical protein